MVSESGLKPDSVRKLREAGYHGFLVGEALMRAEDPAQAIAEFISDPKPAGRSVWVKICGITNVEDALAASEAGADMLGFNFYKRSPRFIEPAAAREIVDALRAIPGGMREPPMMIGVFVNESIEQVVQVADDVSLNGIQLHGDETTDYCRRLREASPRRFVIKALASHSAQILEQARNYSTEALLLDGFDSRLRGGTGRLANWNMARKIVAKSSRVFLAGGLSPENVAEAIATVQPYAVDACSSLESSPGRKSAQRMKEFVDSVRASKLPQHSGSQKRGR
jgi:phosphoribosylanthranilate isomerase